MLSKADNEFLTRSGPERRWAICCAASGCRLAPAELPERDGPPRKIKILGEGPARVSHHRRPGRHRRAHCPHRAANLYYGRNEECGIRCAFHGWKFDVDGNCVDLPTSPPDRPYWGRSSSSPTRRANGAT